MQKRAALEFGCCDERRKFLSSWRKFLQICTSTAAVAAWFFARSSAAENINFGARARACEEVLKLQLDLQRAHTRAHWLEADQFFAAAAFFPAFAAQLDLYEVYSQEEESLNTRVRKR